MSKFLDETGVEHLSQQIKTYVDDAIAAIASAGSGPKLKSILLSPESGEEYVIPANTPMKLLIVPGVLPASNNPGTIKAKCTSPVMIDGVSYSISSAMYGTNMPIGLVMTVEATDQITMINRNNNMFLFEVY